MGRNTGSVNVNNKGKILDLLDKNRKGLTAEELNNSLVLGKTVHSYLYLLVNDGLIEWFSQKGNILKTYRITDKYYEPERQKKAIKTLEMIKGLAKNSFISFQINKISQKERDILREYGII